MSHTRQSFLIPELNIVANDAQLKNMQRKMLLQQILNASDHYAKQSQQKLNRSESEQKTYRNFYNPQTRAETEIDHQYMKNVAAYNKSFGIDLAESYKKEIQRKQAKKRQERDMERKQQEHMIRLAQSQLYLDKIRNHQIHESFRREAHQDLNQKEKRRMEEKKMQQLEKQMYQRRYSTNLLSLNKQQSFRKHYVNVVDAIEQNQKNYLSSVAPANKYKQYQKQRLIQNSIKQSENKLREQLQQQFAIAEKHRAELRDSLVLQIRQKQEKKKQQINELRSQGYTSGAYLNRHHPINNPVDFKITHDNRYIMKQLHSGLARSGSQSLI